jgi:uncharacterized protein (DUF608 family)
MTEEVLQAMPLTEPLNPVAVMDEYIYQSLSHYYTALGKLGYYKYADVKKLLVLLFYRDFVFNDYRGFISRSDYLTIERALNCLFGTTCLMPYPDYLKMGNVQLGGITELATRVKNLENTTVVKPFDSVATDDSDVIILTEEE